jgi:hypothetical protein
VIADGPAANRLMQKFLDGAKPAGELGGILDIVAPGAGLRIGVFDH